MHHMRVCMYIYKKRWVESVRKKGSVMSCIINLGIGGVAKIKPRCNV